MATPEGVHLVLRAFDAERKRHDQLAAAVCELLDALNADTESADWQAAALAVRNVQQVRNLLVMHSNRREQEQHLYPWEVTA